MLDLSEPYDAHIDHRLRSEPIVWLGTSGAAGRPHMVPMWFLWDGATFTLFSLPNTRKLRDIATNPAVVLTLEAADQGYDVVIVEGRAALVSDLKLSGLTPAFVAKYAGIPRRWPPNEWAQMFSQTISVSPTRLTAWRTQPGKPEQRRSIRLA